MLGEAGTDMGTESRRPEIRSTVRAIVRVITCQRPADCRISVTPLLDPASGLSFTVRR